MEGDRRPLLVPQKLSEARSADAREGKGPDHEGGLFGQSGNANETVGDHREVGPIADPSGP